MTWWNEDEYEPWPSPPPPPQGKGGNSDDSDKPDQPPSETQPSEEQDDLDEKDRDSWEKVKNKLRQEQGDEAGAQASSDDEGQGKEQKQGSQSGQEIKTDYTPKYPWQNLIKKFISKSTILDRSYSKANRRNAGGPEELEITGSSVVRPGEKELDPIYKMCFVVDSSGSMIGSVDKALIEVQKLLSVVAKGSDPQFGLVFFTTDAYYYSCNLKKGEAIKVNSFDELMNPPPNATKLSLKDVLNSAYSGGTVFSRQMADQIKNMLKQNYNVCMFTDEGILDQVGTISNWKNFLSVYTSAVGKHLFLILNNQRNFKLIVDKMGGLKPDNFSHL